MRKYSFFVSTGFNIAEMLLFNDDIPMEYVDELWAKMSIHVSKFIKT